MLALCVFLFRFFFFVFQFFFVFFIQTGFHRKRIFLITFFFNNVDFFLLCPSEVFLEASLMFGLPSPDFFGLSNSKSIVSWWIFVSRAFLQLRTARTSLIFFTSKPWFTLTWCFNAFLWRDGFDSSAVALGWTGRQRNEASKGWPQSCLTYLPIVFAPLYSVLWTNSFEVSSVKCGGSLKK